MFAKTTRNQSLSLFTFFLIYKLNVYVCFFSVWSVFIWAITQLQIRCRLLDLIIWVSHKHGIQNLGITYYFILIALVKSYKMAIQCLKSPPDLSSISSIDGYLGIESRLSSVSIVAAVV